VLEKKQTNQFFTVFDTEKDIKHRKPKAYARVNAIKFVVSAQQTIKITKHLPLPKLAANLKVAVTKTQPGEK
jgi:hypothetical protein